PGRLVYPEGRVMPKYRVTGPDGQTYDVTAPEGATEEEVMAYVQQNVAKPQVKSEAATRDADSRANRFEEVVRKTPGLFDLPGTFEPGYEVKPRGSFSDAVAQGVSMGG